MRVREATKNMRIREEIKKEIESLREQLDQVNKEIEDRLSRNKLTLSGTIPVRRAVEDRPYRRTPLLFRKDTKVVQGEKTINEQICYLIYRKSYLCQEIADRYTVDANRCDTVSEFRSSMNLAIEFYFEAIETLRAINRLPSNQLCIRILNAYRGMINSCDDSETDLRNVCIEELLIFINEYQLPDRFTQDAAELEVLQNCLSLAISKFAAPSKGIETPTETDTMELDTPAPRM